MIEITVTIISTLGVIIQAIISNSTKKKISKFDELKQEIIKILNLEKIEGRKTFLTDFMAEVDKGVSKSTNQIKRAYEIKEEYNSLGGDSYVDEQWEDLEKRGLLKRPF